MPEPGPTALPPKVAIVLAAHLAAGAAANVAACLAAGLAAADPTWAGRPLMDAAGLPTVASSHVPIAVLRADPDTMRALLRRAIGPDVSPGPRVGSDVSPSVSPGAGGPDAPDVGVCLFPAYAQAIHDPAAYWSVHEASVHADESMLGIGIRGPKRWVNRLTGTLALWR